MADKKTSNAEEPKKASKNAEKKKSNKKNPFKSMAKFFKGVNAERKKVVWPTAKETIKNSIIVLVVVIIVGVAIYAVDSVLSLGMKGIKNLAADTTVSQSVEEDSAEDELLEDTTADEADAEAAE